MKKTFLCLGLLIALNIYSQEKIVEFDNTLKTSSSSLKDVIPIVNEKNGDISIFLMDATKVYGYLLNRDFQVVDSLESKAKSRKYKLLIGKSISNNNDYRVYLANKKQDKFASINFSYGENNSDLNEFELSSKKELLVQTVTYNNVFYLISILKNTSTLCLYKFDYDGKYERTELDFSTNKFINNHNKEISLFKLISRSTGAYGLKKEISLKKIDENSPTSIEVSSEMSKLYLRENNIVFTFDENENQTQIITIDLNSYKNKVSHIDKPGFKRAVIEGQVDPLYRTGPKMKTNSFLKGNNIFLIGSTQKEFVFMIKNYSTNQILKEYKLFSKDTITFKNTPIIQKGGIYDDYRELEKTKKFLRKITNGNIGVSVYKMNDHYQITLGGKEEIKRGGMMMPMGGFGMPIATMGSVSVFFNPTAFAFNSYSSTKSTHIKGLFDFNFNHIKGEVRKNAFDKIKDFKSTKSTAQKGKTVFKYKDYYILGNYFFWDKKYILRKFKD